MWAGTGRDGFLVFRKLRLLFLFLPEQRQRGRAATLLALLVLLDGFLVKLLHQLLPCLTAADGLYPRGIRRT